MEKFGVGQAVRRKEDERFLKGAGSYLDDLNLDNMAHAAVLRSPYAHARITAIDVSDARDMPGVSEVFTGADYAKTGNGPFPTLTAIDGLDDHGVRHPPRHALALDTVRFVGDPVAFVVAETKQQALNALEAIDVDYDELEPLTDLAHALDEDAPKLWPELDGNLVYTFFRGDRGATDEAIGDADHVVELELINNRLAPAAIEPRGAIGDWNDDDDQYILHVSGQAVHAQRGQMADAIFKVPHEKIRVAAPDVGGGFGAKNFVYPENVLCMWAAKELKRPVKWVAERSENFLTEIHGRDHVTTATLALSSDGKITALNVDTIANMGAYLSSFSTIIPTSASWVVMGGAYDIPNVAMQVRAAFTNTVPVDAYRGAGRPEAAYIIERLIDVAAAQTGMDKLELRRKNFITEFPYKTALGMVVDCGEFAQNLDLARGHIDVAGFAARQKASEATGKLRGLGYSTYLEVTLGGPIENAEIRFDDDGGVTMLVGTQSTGQGHETAYSQLIHSELGIDPDKIRYVHGDTGLIKEGYGHGGSRSLATCGHAIQNAAGDIIEKGKKAAAHLMDATEDQIDFTEGLFSVRGTNKALSVLEIEAALRDTAEEVPENVPATLTSSGSYEREAFNYPNGCHIAEVEVDPDTGHVEIAAYAIVDDFGRIINPLIASGQIMGGAVQGIGQALLEGVVYDNDSGQPVTGSFMDYTMPRADDIPDFALELNENVPTKTNPLGVKGAGEAGATGAPPAIVNAVCDALQSRNVRHIDMPLTPEKVWRAANGGNQS
ncbi:MAG: xanthine dehydrogenase family protein molybdopterin-binding subunit [Hyphomicrobiales bacterium]